VVGEGRKTPPNNGLRLPIRWLFGAKRLTTSG
jgi:hypothetical protein